eukprot:129919-Amorphochlora_amoeboformis.AAC.1
MEVLPWHDGKLIMPIVYLTYSIKPFRLWITGPTEPTELTEPTEPTGLRNPEYLRNPRYKKINGSQQNPEYVF